MQARLTALAASALLGCSGGLEGAPGDVGDVGVDDVVIGDSPVIGVETTPHLVPIDDVWGACKPRSWKRGKTISGPYSPPPRNARTTQLTELPDGRVLLGHAIQIWDPKKDTYETLPTPPPGRWYRLGSTVTLLADKKTVLLTGGDTDDGTWGSRAVDLFDLELKTWRVGAPMGAIRSQHQAFLLSTGKVLVIGGLASGDVDPTPFVELYDPATGKWTESETTVRAPAGNGFVSVVELTDHRLLVANGYGTVGFTSGALDQIFDPLSETWRYIKGKPPGYSRQWTVRLDDGRVLGGGQGEDKCLPGSAGSAACMSAFDLAAETWSLVGTVPLKMNNSPWTSIHAHALPCGSLALIGRTDWTEFHHLLFSPTRMRWYELPIGIAEFTEYGRMLKLSTGDVMAAYGDTETGGVSGRVFPLTLTED